jgi:hypothetical protein
LSRFAAFLLVIALFVPASLLFTAHDVLGVDLLPLVYVNASTGSDGYYGDVPVYSAGLHGPKKTITSGISAVADNGTVNVAAGTYTEHAIHLNNTMNLVGAGALTTIIDGAGHGYVVQVSSAPDQRNTISGFTIKNGAASGSDPGGGVYVGQFHIVTINDCAITGNYKGGGSGMLQRIGGGVCNDGGTLYMNRCTVSGNTADFTGGGVATVTKPGFAAAVTELTNCTISGNTVTGDNNAGGGVYCSHDSNVRLVNVTVAYNRATGAGSVGGGFSNSSKSSMYFKNCIVANNTAGMSQWNNGYDGIGTGTHSQGYNIGNDTVGGYFDQATDKINTDPLLGPLQNNGGPTSTHAITTSSPAFNAGTAAGAPTTDQRGVARPQLGLFDIGAFELQILAPTVTAINPGQGNQGESLNVIVTGTNLTGATAVTFGAGIIVTGFTVNSSTQVTAVISIASDAAAGSRTVSVSTQGGTGSLDNGFMVNTLQTPLIGSGSHSSTTSTSFSPAQTVVNPTFTVQNASLSTGQPADGGSVTVNATIGNTSAVNGTTSVRLYVNGRVECEKGVAVASGKQVPVSFNISRSEPGTYQVSVNGAPAGSFTVQTANMSDALLYASIACIFASLALGLVCLLRRRSY